MNGGSPIPEDILYPPTLVRLVGRVLTAAPIALNAIGHLSYLPYDPTKLIGYAHMVGYLAPVGGQWTLTPVGQRIVDAAESYRAAVIDVTERFRPPWIHLVAQGRAAVVSARSDAPLITCLVETGLLSATDPEALAFWDRLAAAARDRRLAQLQEVGRAGEQATITCERTRTSREPIWRALETDGLGYDIESIRSAADHRPLYIEVKASRLHWSEARMHLSRNEWRFLSAHANDAVIDLWSFPGGADWHRRIGIAALAPHMPTNHGSGSWESCEIAYRDIIGD